jgi:hypothetical protein
MLTVPATTPAPDAVRERSASSLGLQAPASVASLDALRALDRRSCGRLTDTG